MSLFIKEKLIERERMGLQVPKGMTTGASCMGRSAREGIPC